MVYILAFPVTQPDHCFGLSVWKAHCCQGREIMTQTNMYANMSKYLWEKSTEDVQSAVRGIFPWAVSSNLHELSSIVTIIFTTDEISAQRSSLSCSVNTLKLLSAPVPLHHLCRESCPQYSSLPSLSCFPRASIPTSANL